MRDKHAWAVDALRDRLAASPLLRTIAELNRRGKALWLYGPNARLRPLTAAEIAQLRSQGNWAEDWKAIWVHPEFCVERIWRCRLLGSVVLGPMRGTTLVDEVPIPSGLYDATIRNCVLGPDVLVQDVGLLERTVLGARSVVFRCSSLVGGRSSFGNGTSVHVGLTCGGREVPLVGEAAFDELAAVALAPGSDAAQAYRALAADYAAHLRFDCNLLMTGARVLRSGTLRHVLLGPGAVVDGACELHECSLLGEEGQAATVGAGCIVRRTVLQWGARVEDGALVESTLVGEATRVARFARVTHAVLGPNSTIQQGEVTSVLAGPFTALNHESLLIATLWPAGRGNVSGGARIGSNHTGKAPDQEARLGEGVFIGLGAAIKFPVNLEQAPYTLIASGATLLPQRVAFPFSLILPPIRRPSEVPEGWNEILPAWVLYASPYTVVRNELKYASRNRAVHQKVRAELFSMALLEAVHEARGRLAALDARPEGVFTERDEPGLGKNYMTEQGRVQGLETYEKWIRRTVLRALWQGVQQRAAEDLDEALERAGECTLVTWGRSKGYFSGEPLRAERFIELLEELVRLEHEIAVAVEQSKSREYRRGCRIMPDYDQLHPLPSDDPVVRHCWETAHRLRTEIARFLHQHGFQQAAVRFGG